jgi:hypothetical protein
MLIVSQMVSIGSDSRPLHSAAKVPGQRRHIEAHAAMPRTTPQAGGAESPSEGGVL